MLQWMGGSRRKVATSRKSTYKRQKQFFEQRKRQQQQQTVGIEIDADGEYKFNRTCENSRSLDILSLANVLTVAQKRTTSHLNERDDSEEEEDDFSMNHQTSHSPPAIHINENVSVEQCQQEDKSLIFHEDNQYSENIPVILPDHHEKLDEHDKKSYHLKLSTAQISIIDLLGDGGPNNSTEEVSDHAQEAHVAFSVEGLGKVETETPVCSPGLPGRSYLNDLSSPIKARRPLFPSNQLDFGFDDLVYQEDVVMKDIDLQPYDNIREHHSEDINDLVGNDYKSFNSRKTFPVKWNSSTSSGVLHSEEPLFGSRDSPIWNSPDFLDSFDNLGEYESFRANWVDQSDFSNERDYFNSKDRWMQECNFESWNLQNKRSRGSGTKRTTNCSVTEPSFPYSKLQIPDELPYFGVRDMSRYPTIGTENEAKDVVNRFVDDRRESSSQLSEESSSSAAVKGDATKSSWRKPQFRFQV